MTTPHPVQQLALAGIDDPGVLAGCAPDVAVPPAGADLAGQDTQDLESKGRWHMKTIEYRYQDKSAWGDGPWQTEPDKRQWQDPATGLPCLIVRQHYGALCGYVGVPVGHPFFKAPYADLPIAVHGGLTFSDFCRPGRPGEEDRGICHLVEPGEDDRVWWLGFDCAHAFDLLPSGILSLGPDNDCTYRTWQYVESQVQSLALQLHAARETPLRSQTEAPPDVP